MASFFRSLFGNVTKMASEKTAPSDEVKKLVDGLIAAHPVMVFSKTYCPYCTKAKQVLGSFGLAKDTMSVLELENHPQCDQIQDYLLALTGKRSVPRVFIGGQCIGGGDDTAAKAKDGSLEELLRKAGAIGGAK